MYLAPQRLHLGRSQAQPTDSDSFRALAMSITYYYGDCEVPLIPRGVVRARLAKQRAAFFKVPEAPQQQQFPRAVVRAFARRHRNGQSRVSACAYTGRDRHSLAGPRSDSICCAKS